MERWKSKIRSQCAILGAKTKLLFICYKIVLWNAAQLLIEIARIVTSLSEQFSFHPTEFLMARAVPLQLLSPLPHLHFKHYYKLIQ